jgi:hypothetical protein
VDRVEMVFHLQYQVLQLQELAAVVVGEEVQALPVDLEAAVMEDPVDLAQEVPLTQVEALVVTMVIQEKVAVLASLLFDINFNS